MRAGGTRWDKNSSWYADMEYEMLRFTGLGEAKLDDQFDSASLLSRGFDTMAEVEPEDMMDEEEIEMRTQDPRRQTGRSKVTGY